MLKLTFRDNEASISEIIYGGEGKHSSDPISTWRRHCGLKPFAAAEPAIANRI